MLIKFTNASKLYGIRLKEYHRVMDENETMEVSEERYRELAGDNKWHLVFAVPYITELNVDDIIQISNKTYEDVVIKAPTTEVEKTVVKARKRKEA